MNCNFSMGKQKKKANSCLKTAVLRLFKGYIETEVRKLRKLLFDPHLHHHFKKEYFKTTFQYSYEPPPHEL